MLTGKNSFSKTLIAALRREEGGVTVEAVLWMPFFMLLFGMVVDASLLLGGQAEVLRVVQDNRAVSLGRYQNLEDARLHIESEIVQLSDSAMVTVEVIDGIITSVVVIDAADLTATGLFDGFADIDIVVRAQHLSEA